MTFGQNESRVTVWLCLRSLLLIYRFVMTWPLFAENSAVVSTLSLT